MSEQKSKKSPVKETVVAPAAPSLTPSSASAHVFWSNQPVVASAYSPPPTTTTSHPTTDPSPATSSTSSASADGDGLSPSSPVDFKEEEGVIDPHYLFTHKLPFPLPSGFEWSDLDIRNADDLSALHFLLRHHYVEDSRQSSRVEYSPAFLQWALTSPNHLSRYHVAVRLSSSRKVIAFICGTRQLIRIRQHVGVTLEISFLCVHSKLRQQRLAPVLIKEITRRISVHDTVKHAVYTVSTLIHQPLTHCTYYHRPLNVSNLIAGGFIPHPALLSTPAPRTHVARTAAYNRFVKRNALPEKGGLPEMRVMREEDVAAVHSMLSDHLSAFSLVPLYDEDEVRHWFLPRDRVVYSYVLYEQSALVGFASFQDIPRLHNYNTPNPIALRTANASYHICRSKAVTKAAIMKEVLCRAKEEGFDVYSALDMMDFSEWMEADGKFLKSNGGVYYYLFNYHCLPMTPQQIGMVVV